jgi:hypothetical protein
MLRVTFLLFLLICILTQSYFLAGFLYLAYLVWYSGYEIVVLAILVDGYYGAFFGFPTFTIVTFLAWMLITYLKKLLLYTGGNEVIS